MPSPKRQRARPAGSIRALLSDRVVGQPRAVDAIVPFVEMFQSGLSPAGRPAGVFMLLGPTGTGKTHTCEALAEVLHGSAGNVLRIDCGEYTDDHEVAKLIGAPPGYLGHRETRPLLSQAYLTSYASEKSKITIVLFDEIEKAAPAMARVMLAILDKATLTLGDCNKVNFENCLIFLTTNLGAKEIQKNLRSRLGFHTPASDAAASADTERIARAAIRKQFTPEFINRIDSFITYDTLTAESLHLILDHSLAALREHITARLGARGFALETSKDCRAFLIERGTSPEHGAREIKRQIHKHLTQPIAVLVNAGAIPAGATVKASEHVGQIKLRIV